MRHTRRLHPAASSGSAGRRDEQRSERQAEGHSMTDNGYIDINVQIGPRAGGARGAPIEDVVAERDRHGVRTSLVRHRTALLAEAELGNRLLLDEVGADPGLVPIGVLS